MNTLSKSDAVRRAAIKKEDDLRTLRKLNEKAIGAEGKIVKMLCFFN